MKMRPLLWKKTGRSRRRDIDHTYPDLFKKVDREERVGGAMNVFLFHLM